MLFSACGSPVVCDAVLEVKQMTLRLDDGSKAVFRNVKFLMSNDVDDLLLGRSTSVPRQHWLYTVRICSRVQHSFGWFESF